MEQTIIQWLYEAATIIKKALKEPLVIDHKSGRTDLVTNVDKTVQNFFTEKIAAFDPEAKILGEENGQDKTPITNGRVFVIDPIDGTLNFVLQKENFCIMIALYEEGVGQLGFIYDVMNDDLFWGGPKIGKVYRNQEELPAPENKPLEAGLLGVGAAAFATNQHHIKEIANQSMGIRILGCAGLEFLSILKGTQIGYISLLSPWDYAAGKIMLEQLGLATSQTNFQTRELFIGATTAAMAQITACQQ